MNGDDDGAVMKMNDENENEKSTKRAASEASELYSVLALRTLP